MAPSLADSFAHALGLLSADGLPDVNLSTEAGRAVALSLLSDHTVTFHNLQKGSLSSPVSASSVVADFASRFLPAFADLFIDSAFGSKLDDLTHGARGWLLVSVSAPPLGRLLRDRPSTYIALVSSQIADLVSNDEQWKLQSLYAPTTDGQIRREQCEGLIVAVTSLLAISDSQGHPASFLHVGGDVLDRLERFCVRLNGQQQGGPSEGCLRDKYLRFLDGICGYLRTTSPSGLVDMNFVSRAWTRCEATALPGISPCVQLPAGQEMACCAKCLSVRYCSQAHQKAHWKTHKPICFKPTW